MVRVEDCPVPFSGLRDTALLCLFRTCPATTDNPGFSTLVGLHHCRSDMDRTSVTGMEMNQLRDKFFTSHDDDMLGAGATGLYCDINPIPPYIAN